MIRRLWYRSPLLILLALFSLQWLSLLSIKEPTWDAVSYYVYARSSIFDGDLQFDNDYQLSYPTAGEHFASKKLDQVETATGRVANLFAVGTSLLWLPWLSVLRLAAPFIFPYGTGLTGYEQFFVSNLATLSALFGFLAILLSYRVAQGVINRRLALASAVTLMFVTPLLYYQFREPMYSHTASALAVSLCVYVWWVHYDETGTVWQALGLGGLIGLAGLVRWQNMAYLLLPFVSTLVIWLRKKDWCNWRVWKTPLIYLLLTGAAALAVFSLQMAVWRVLYGSFITIPQGNTFIDWRAPFLIPLLFSPFRGLLPWMPAFFLIVIGLLVLSKRKPQLGLPLLLMLLLVIYINGSTRDWFAGGGFGPRRLTSELVIFVVGYAAFLQLLPRRFRSWGAVLLGIGLALQQWILLRYGLEEELGGRVMSMAPTFYWEEIPLTRFISELFALVLRAWQWPLDFLIFSGSPLDMILHKQTWPLQHLGALIATALFVLLISCAVIIWWNRPKMQNHPVWVLIVTAIFLGLVDLWILVGS
jgi:hypothetical protein